MGFAQNVHMLNQDVHKNLRLNKPGVKLDKVGGIPSDYNRPPGFSLIPTLLGTNHHVLRLIKANGKIHSYDDEQMR